MADLTTRADLVIGVGNPLMGDDGLGIQAIAALRGIAFSYGLPQMFAGAPSTLPIPDPANFGLSGNSSTRLANVIASGRILLDFMLGSAVDMVAKMS